MNCPRLKSLRPRDRGLRYGLLMLIVGGGFCFGCARAPVAATPAAVAAKPSAPLTRYISDDAALVFYVNLERINASSYRSFFMKAAGKLELAKLPFLKSCRELYLTAHHALPHNEYGYFSFLVSGCDAHSTPAFPNDKEIQSGPDGGAPKRSKLRARFKTLGNGIIGIRTTQSDAMLPDWSEATNPLKFSVRDADIAIRVGFPMLQRFASSARVPDAQIRILAQTVEMRLFVRLEPVVTVSAEIEFVNEAPAEALVRFLPAVIETLKARVDVRNKGLEQALRDLKVQRSGRIVSLSVTLPRFDTERWVVAQPASGSQRIATSTRPLPPRSDGL